MRKALLGVLAAFLLFGTTVSGTRAFLAYHEPETLGFVYLQTEENYAAKYKAWFQACDYTDYSCIGVNPPQVVSEYMQWGLLGYYDGTGTVYVNRRLRGQQLNATLMHEMVHYLQKMVGGLEVPGYAEPICHAENEAFAVVDLWLEDHGYQDLMRGDTWWKPYRHCYPWYKPGYKAIKRGAPFIWWTAPQI